MLKLESIDLDDIFQGVDSLKAEPLQLPPIDDNDAEFLFNLEDGLFSWPLTTLDQDDDDENLLSKQFCATTGSISPKAVVDGVLPVTDHQNVGGNWNETVATAKAHTNLNSNSSDGSEGHSESAVVVTVQKPGTTNRSRTAAEKKQKIREKNRRAQNKYREKLKTQRQETEVHLEMAIADVERLRLENTRLSSQVDVMERILEVRESAVQLLEAGKATQGSTSSKDSGLLKRLGPSGPRLSAFASHPKNEIMVQLNESAEKCPLTNLTFQEVAAIKASGHDYLKRRYSELAERLRDVLEQVDDRRCTQTSKDMSLEAMKGILWECGCLCFEHAVANPTGMQKLLAASIEDGQDGFGNEGPSLSSTKTSEERARHWATVADQLELTEQQLRQLEPHKNLFQRRIHRITESKRAAVQALNLAVPTSSDVNDQMTITMSETTSRWLQVQAASQELTAIIQEEYIACMEFVAKSFGDVFSPLQKARAIVSSYPDFPDAYSIATAACKALEKRLE